MNIQAVLFGEFNVLFCQNMCLML